MKYTREEFLRIVGKQKDIIIELMEDIEAGAERKEVVSDMAEIFADFVNAFPEEEKAAACAILVGIGIAIEKTQPQDDDWIVLEKSGEEN